MTKYNKLVRDKIPEIIEKKGKKYTTKKLDTSSYIQELKVKFNEELNEYMESENDADSIEELADVLEIIHSLAIIHGKSFNDVEATRQKKFIERGGFTEKIYLIEVEDDD
jgi:predicted house-cleaning noncanonical NTP pyrophosphatase (MazG superfamily)